MKVKLHFNPYQERWVMRDMLGRNMMEFPDCGNFSAKYPGVLKGVINVVEDPTATVLLTYPLEQDGIKG